MSVFHLKTCLVAHSCPDAASVQIGETCVACEIAKLQGEVDELRRQLRAIQPSSVPSSDAQQKRREWIVVWDVRNDTISSLVHGEQLGYLRHAITVREVG